MDAERNRFAVEIPHIGSVYLTHSWNGYMQGLKAVPAADRPYVPIVFFAFRIMVGIGLTLLTVAVTGAVLRWRNRLFTTRWFQIVCMAVMPLGFVAVLAGWTTTEAGRQPFVVYGHLRTADAVAPLAAGAVAVASSLLFFILLYAVLLLAFLWYGWRIVIHRPEQFERQPNMVRPGIDRAGTALAGGSAANAHPLPAAEGPWTYPCFCFRRYICVVIYVLADGFDPGVGILFLVAPRNKDRDLMMESIAPLWDGNETWLVAGGTLLLAAFPPGYYVLLPAFYLAIVTMLFSLILRGVAFEFRFQAAHFRPVWDWAFAGGSLLAALSQGFILGGFIEGVPVRDGIFAGSTFDFLSPLGLLCGLGLAGGYALLGAGWLIWKTIGPTQIFGREIGRAALIAQW